MTQDRKLEGSRIDNNTTHLRRVIEIFLPLYGAHARLSQGVDPIEPLARPGPDIACDDHAKRITVYLWQRLPIHLPREQHLFCVLTHFSIGHGNRIVEDLSFPAEL